METLTKKIILPDSPNRVAVSYYQETCWIMLIYRIKWRRQVFEREISILIYFLKGFQKIVLYYLNFVRTIYHIIYIDYMVMSMMTGVWIIMQMVHIMPHYHIVIIRHSCALLVWNNYCIWLYQNDPAIRTVLSSDHIID